MRSEWLRGSVAALAVLLGGGASVALAQDEDEPPGPTPIPMPDEVAPADDDAAAQGPMPRIYVVAVATDASLEPIAARVGAGARAALRRVEGIDWQTPDRRYLGYNDFALDRLTRGRERLEAGRQAYLDLELDRAVEQLTGAVEDFDAAANAVEDPQALGDALLFLGASQAFAGRTREARRTFERLHVQMPHVRPDPNLFNPDVVQRFEQAAPRDGEAPSASITIESEPPGAIAYVDFVPRGVAPVTVGQLVGGTHIVRVSRPGAPAFVQQLDVARGGSQQVNAYLEDDASTQGLADQVAGLASEELESLAPGGSLSQVALALEVDRIGVIRVAAGDNEDLVALELLMFDVGTGRRLLRGQGPAPIALGLLERAVDQLVGNGLGTVLRPTRGTDEEQIIRRPPPPPPPPPIVDDGDPALYERWWFWAGVGGAVALGVVLTVVATSSGGDELGQSPGGQVVLSF